MPWTETITFTPAPEDLAEQRKGKAYTCLTGPNNSGKSAYLKGIAAAYGPEASYFLPVSRFVGNIALRVHGPQGFMQYDPDKLFKSDVNQDGAYFDPSALIREFSDDDRNKLFALAKHWVGSQFSVTRVDPKNELSDPILVSDGSPLEHASTGTRLLFGILTACSNPKITRVFIDEPELGLAPSLQSQLADALINPENRRVLFPHLQELIVATHSHLFLDRNDFGNNFTIQKQGSLISATPIEMIHEFHQTQLTLLGNSLASLFLPEAIIVVEGKTDLPFLKRAIETKFIGRNISVIESQGGPKEVVRRFILTLGQRASSPYANRIFVVFDSVYNSDQRQECIKLGINENHLVVWENNGIEFLYPRKLMAEVFKTTATEDKNIKIDGDRVSMGGAIPPFTKAALSQDICSRIVPGTEFPEEIQRKLLTPLAIAIGE